MLAFLTFTLQSYTEEWEAAIRYSLIPRGSDINVDHDTSGLIRMDSTAKANYLSKLTQNGLMTRNEARLKLNLPEVEGGQAHCADQPFTTGSTRGNRPCSTN